MKKVLKGLIKWSLLVGISYFVLTTLILGYDNIDKKERRYKFSWSGLNALWNADEEFGFKIDEPIITSFYGVDGPFVFGDDLFFVTEDNELKQQKLDSSRMITVRTNEAMLPEFEVQLIDDIKMENDHYPMPEKLAAVSDIEGNFTALYGFLLANHIIDQKANWIYGNGHLVLNGDFFDRGDQVTQVLWLIYHLEGQANRQGGKVHFILGNHEIMNLYGNVKYVDEKYIQAAKQISGISDWNKALSYLYSQNSEIGKWLRSKNVVEKIGDIIFVHGGLNIDHSNGKYSIEELNAIAKKYYGIQPTVENLQEERDKLATSVINSPYWDRRLNVDFKTKASFKLNGIEVKETTQQELETILQYYQSSKIVIGHCIVSDIVADYNNKVIKIDVKHGDRLKSGDTKGIFIENNLIYKIDDVGNRTKLTEM